MAGKYWRLLNALCLILLAPACLRGQDTLEERNPVFNQKFGMLRSFPPIRPGRLLLFPGSPRQSPVVPGTIAFDGIVGAAGIIFSGRVTSVGRIPLPSGDGPSSTTVTFQVDHAIRGIPSGQDYVIQPFTNPRVGRSVEPGRALSRRGARAAVFVSSEQAGAHQPGGRSDGQVRVGF
jgi:hypothetical protein